MQGVVPIEGGQQLHAVIFDLDGTLVDSLADIAHNMNRALSELGLPTHPEAAYRHFVGDGVRQLVERAAAGAPEPVHGALLARLAEIYTDCRWPRTRAYEGAAELLGRLRGAGLKLGVLSNKPHALCGPTLAACGLLEAVDAVQGVCEGLARKPSSEGLLRVCSLLGVEAQRCAMVGDSDVDMATGLAGGALTVGACWGFRGADELGRSGAALLAQSPEEVWSRLVAGGWVAEDGANGGERVNEGRQEP